MHVNLMLFDGMVPLDVVGPYEVLSRVPGWTVALVAADLAPVATDRGLCLLPTSARDQAAPSDVLVVPGGAGIDPLLTDDAWLSWIAQEAARAQTVLAICTGSLLLGAAGLLAGRRAGGHWQARDLLARFGAAVSDDRMTIDGKIYSSGGVTSGIDMALKLVGDRVGPETAQAIQLAIEYDPAPPWPGGSPSTSPPAVVEAVRRQGRTRRARREAAVEHAAARLAPPIPEMS